MHWFWRGAVAAMAGGMSAFLAACLAWIPVSLRLVQFRVNEDSVFAVALVLVSVGCVSDDDLDRGRVQRIPEGVAIQERLEHHFEIPKCRHKDHKQKQGGPKQGYRAGQILATSDVPRLARLLATSRCRVFRFFTEVVRHGKG